MFWKNVIKKTIGKIVFVKRNIAEKRKINYFILSLFWSLK